MLYRTFTVLLALFAFISSSSTAAADTVLLENGDRITGEVISMIDGKLKFKTDYAGVLLLDWAKIESVDSEKPLAVYRKKNIKEEKEVDSIRKVGKGAPVSIEETAAINSRPKNYDFKGSLQAGWDKSEGNTRKESVNAAFDLTYRVDKDRWKAHGDHYWGASKGERSDYNWMLSGEYNRFLDEKMYLSGTGSVKQDQFQDLSLRSVLGLGLGYQFFDSDSLTLSGEAGPAYVWEEYSSREDRDFVAGRWNIDFGWWLFPERLKLFHSQTGLVSVEDTENWIWQSKSGVLFPIVQNFFGTFQYNYDWTNDPVPGKQEDDSRIIFNLGYSFADFPWEWN